MLARIAHLHRARVRAQQQPALDVEGVVHRPGGVILRLVERGEVVPVGLDFRAVGDIEADRAEDLLDPLPGADDGVDTAPPAAASGQGHVECILRQAGFHLPRFERVAAAGERLFDRLLGLVDAAARARTLLGRQACQSLEQLGEHTGFAEVARLDLLQLGRRACRFEGGSAPRRPGGRVPLVRHSYSWAETVANKKGGGEASLIAPPSALRRRGWLWPERRSFRTPAGRTRRGRPAPCDRARSRPSSARS